MRRSWFLVSLCAFLLLPACGDIFGPSDGLRGLWIRETGVVLNPGETMTFTARIQVRDASAEAQEAGTAIIPPTNARWWSSNENVIRLPRDTEGMVEAIAPGRATLWVQVGGRRDSATVTVLSAGEVPSHRWKAVATYRTGTCALDVNGHAYCWGDDFWGGWGTGGNRRQFTNAYRPVRVNSPLAFEEIDRGLGFACARTADGQVWCWGLHHGAQLGHARTGRDYEAGPVRVDFPGRATALTVGSQHACLLDAQNQAHCWGSNLTFQLGVGTHITSSRDRGGRTLPVAFDGTFRSISSAGYHTCGITPSQELYCWGRVPIGSDFQDAHVPTPARVPTTAAPHLIRAGNGNSCFLTEAGEVHCWGGNETGQSGRAPDAGTAVPVPIATGLRFEHLSLSGGLTCGIAPGGQAWCWGAGAALDPGAISVCGDPRSPFPCTGTPIPVAAGYRFRRLSVGDAVCGITIEGELYCWGQNDWGHLGNGRPSIESTHLPQRVLDPQ